MNFIVLVYLYDWIIDELQILIVMLIIYLKKHFLNRIANNFMNTRLLTGGEYPQGILDVIEGVIGYLGLSVGYSSIEYAALRIISNIYFACKINLF